MADTSLVFSIIGRDKTGPAFKSAAEGAKKLGAGIKLGIGAAIAGLGLGAALDAAFEKEDALAKLKAQAGDNAWAEAAGKAAGNLYLNAYGESVGEAAQGVRELFEGGLLKDDATQAQIESLTGQAMSLASAFDQDVSKAAEAAGQMIRTGMAKDGQEALDILTRGMQLGVDKADDLADTFNEYGTQFRKMGIDGKTAVGLMAQGLKGGARDADIVADAFKEFSIRVIDGSKLTAQGFADLGLSADDMAAKFGKGGKTAHDALEKVLGKLRTMKDPIKQAATATALFGTQSEDLGKALFELDLDGAAAEMGDVAGAAAKVDSIMGSTASSTLTAFKRQLKDVVINGLGKLIQKLKPAGDGVKIFWDALRGKSELNEFDGKLRMLNNAGVNINAWVRGSALPALGDLKAELGKLKGPAEDAVAKIKDAFKPGGIDLAAMGKDWAADAATWGGDIIEGVKTGLQTGDWSGLGKAVGDGLGNALENAGGFAVKVWAWIGEQIKKVKWFDLALQIGKQVPTMLIGLATGILNFDLGSLISGVGDHWFEVLLGIITLALAPAKVIGALTKVLAKIPLVGPILAWGLKALVGASKGLIKGAGRLIGSLGSGFLSGIRSVFPTVGTKLSGAVGGLLVNVRSRAAGFLIEAAKIPGKLAAGILGGIGKVGEAGGRMLANLSRVVAAGILDVLAFLAKTPGRILGTLAGLAGLLVELGTGMLSGFLGAVIGKAEDLWGWCKSLPGAIVSGIGSLSGTLAQLGIDLIGGFIGGIVDKAKELPGVMKDKVVGVAKDALHGFGLFGSPSRLTMKYGRWWTMGFAIGVKQKTKDVLANVQELLDKARERFKAAKDFARDIRAGFRDFANITSIDGGDQGFAGMLDELRAKADKAVAFASGITTLRKRGLNAVTLAQLREAGPDAIGSVEGLLNNAGAIGETNRLVRKIDRAGGRLGTREAELKYGLNLDGPQKATIKAGKQTMHVSFDFSGAGDDALVKALRKAIRVKGGNVQVVLGSK